MLGVLLLLLAVGATIAVLLRACGRLSGGWSFSARTWCVLALGVALALSAMWASRLTSEDDLGPMVVLLGWPVVAATLPTLTADRPSIARPLALVGGLSLLVHVALFGLGFGFGYLLPAALLLVAAVTLSRDDRRSDLTA